MANILAIVGRPNVGKSTLFNRLIERRKAIMDNESGVTRDRQYGLCEWNGYQFNVMDTGGYVEKTSNIFEEKIKTQVKWAFNEATVIVFMVDCGVGLHPLDVDFANLLRDLKKKIFIVANKADNATRELNASEFYALGIDAELFTISSQSGYGTGDLLDQVVKNFEKNPLPETTSLPKIAVVGKPNVGKSSFINTLLDEERTIVTDIAGTTRDAIHSTYNKFGKQFILTDTAGIRKKSKVHDNIEFYSVLRAIKSIEESDVTIVIIDATQGINAQDMNIIELAQKNKKGCVLMVNKWDLISKDTQKMGVLKKEIQEKLGFMAYIPIVFASVLTKQRIFKTIEYALEVYQNKKRKISTAKINEVMTPIIQKHPPDAVRGHNIKIKYCTQLPTQGITFAFFCNFPQYIKDPYKRFLINKIRENFSFQGVPISVIFRKK